jgi:triosephosphate isomerase
VEVVLCPPFVFLPDAAVALAGSAIGLGAQDLSAEVGQGAYTGEVAGAMLREVGCSHVIVGHSERRARHNESDAEVARKAVAALAAGLVPIVCVGETLAERDAGATPAVVGRQLAAVLDVCGVDAFRTVVVAYEPVWAIGTGRTASPEQAQEAHAFTRKVLTNLYGEDTAQRIRIQYGGSVKPSNMAELIAQPDVDGALVGGASLESGSFWEICRAATDYANAQA